MNFRYIYIQNKKVIEEISISMFSDFWYNVETEKQCFNF